MEVEFSKSELENIDEKQLSSKGIYTGEELLSLKIKELPFLVENLFPVSGLVALAGSSDTGKSAFLRQFAISVVTGQENFIGFKLNSIHKSVIYISTEDDKISTAFLLNKQCGNNPEPASLKNLRFIFNSANVIEVINQELEKQSADCVIIDAFSDIYSNDLNAANKVRSFLTKFSDLAEKHTCLFIFLHHTGKRTESFPPSKDNLLGSQGFEAKMRLVMELRRDDQDNTKRHLCIVKGNYIPSMMKESSYVLRFDDNMLFTRLDERVPFAQLAKPDFRKQEHLDFRKKAIEYKKMGHSISEITNKLTSEGAKVARATVGTWVRGIQTEFLKETG